MDASSDLALAPANSRSLRVQLRSPQIKRREFWIEQHRDMFVSVHLEAGDAGQAFVRIVRLCVCGLYLRSARSQGVSERKQRRQCRKTRGAAEQRAAINGHGHALQVQRVI